MAVLVLKKCFNFCTTQSGNFKNLTEGFFEMLITNLRPYYWNSIWLVTQKLANFRVTLHFFFFYSWFHLHDYCVVHIPTPYFPFSPFFPSSHFFHFLPARDPPAPRWECDRSHSVLRRIAFARGNMVTAKNLCDYSRPYRVCPQSTVSEKMTPPPVLAAKDFDVQAANQRSPIQIFYWVFTLF